MKINKESSKFLGKGVEKEVYENPHNPKHAVGIFKREAAEFPERVRGRFYLTKILHLLFPDNIPDIHSASSDPQMIEVDKIIPDEQAVTKNFKKFNSDYCELMDKFDALGIILDPAQVNFKYDFSGNLVYVDSFDPWYKGAGEELAFSMDKLKEAIEKLNSSEKEQCLKYLERLGNIHREYVEKLKA